MLQPWKQTFCIAERCDLRSVKICNIENKHVVRLWRSVIEYANLKTNILHRCTWSICMQLNYILERWNAHGWALHKRFVKLKNERKNVLHLRCISCCKHANTNFEPMQNIMVQFWTQSFCTIEKLCLHRVLESENKKSPFYMIYIFNFEKQMCHNWKWILSKTFCIAGKYFSNLKTNICIFETCFSILKRAVLDRW